MELSIKGLIPLNRTKRKIYKVDKSIKRSGNDKSDIIAFREKYKIRYCADCGAELDEYGPNHHTCCDFCWKLRKSLNMKTGYGTPNILELI